MKRLNEEQRKMAAAWVYWTERKARTLIRDREAAHDVAIDTLMTAAGVWDTHGGITKLIECILQRKYTGWLTWRNAKKRGFGRTESLFQLPPWVMEDATAMIDIGPMLIEAES